MIGIPASSVISSGRALLEDPYLANVVLVVPLETDFADVKGHAYSLRGTPTLTSPSISGYGNNSGDFTGGGKSIEFVDSDDFIMQTTHTAEIWCQPSGEDISGSHASGFHSLFGQREGGGSGYSLAISGGKFTLWTGDTNWFVSSTPGNPLLTSGQNYHVAIVFTPTQMRFYLNGILTISVVVSSYNFGNKAATFNIGVDSFPLWDANAQFFYGKLKNFRLTQGIARYTSNFTPPAGFVSV